MPCLGPAGRTASWAVSPEGETRVISHGSLEALIDGKLLLHSGDIAVVGMKKGPCRAVTAALQEPLRSHTATHGGVTHSTLHPCQVTQGTLPPILGTVW